MNIKNKPYFLFGILLSTVLSCNIPTPGSSSIETSTTEVPVTDVAGVETASVAIEHTNIPPSDIVVGKSAIDVESSGTGPEGRAPYGDSFNINLLERPFLQDMTYVPDLDIKTFSISEDNDWYFISIGLIGKDPNNSLGISYDVELDVDKDGFGDFIITANPPYSSDWTVENVKIYNDENHNTAGISPLKSDAPVESDGYETLMFDGGQGIGYDPDLAWVRMTHQENAEIQFAFKKNLSGNIFMVGVMADAGLKDLTKLDYVDRFTEEDAGSPVKDRQSYPLKALYSVDNTCREAVGFEPTGFEPMSCVKTGAASPTRPSGNNLNSSQPSGAGCSMKPSDCTEDAPYYWPAPHCACSSEPYNQ